MHVLSRIIYEICIRMKGNYLQLITYSFASNEASYFLRVTNFI